MNRSIFLSFFASVFFLFLAINVGKSQSLSSSIITPYTANSNAINGSLNSTMGEIATETFHKSNFLTQGFHQPIYQLEIIGGILDSIPFIVYPNPVTEHLEFNITWQGPYTVQLFDLSGRRIYDEMRYAFPEAEKHFLDMSEYEHTIYLLIVNINNNKRIYSVKISKH
ncbi:MAG: T9SS type A sorting domain-containing protein [Bacteroidota bacterium]